MKIKIYTKAPIWWTSEEWKMSEEEREKIGIKLIDIEYNRDTSTHHLQFKVMRQSGLIRIVIIRNSN